MKLFNNSVYDQMLLNYPSTIKITEGKKGVIERDRFNNVYLRASKNSSHPDDIMMREYLQSKEYQTEMKKTIMTRVNLEDPAEWELEFAKKYKLVKEYE